MLLLGALFALFISGIWLYCLVDLALTPSSECRGLPKAAWIAVVAGTFVIGAAAWLAARHPAGVSLVPAPPGGLKPRPSQPDGDRRPPGSPEGRDPDVPHNGRPDPRGWDGLADRLSLEAEAALLRHPAGRSRPRGTASRTYRPTGPDDDPEFLRSLDRAIHRAGEDGWVGENGWAGEDA
jgi:hypothetical protein